MLIGGLQPLSLIDYPGMVACVLFTQGCNFRCSFCHNPELVDPKLFGSPIPIKEILSFLKKRKGFLDGVVICGGEPLLQDGLLGFIERVKGMGYMVKLDTNGSLPERLLPLLPSIDYIAMDIKAPLPRYRDITITRVDEEKIRRSIHIIKGSKKGYEFRTTLPKSRLSKDDIIEIGREIKGAELYVLQRFSPRRTSLLLDETYTTETLEEIRRILERRFVKRCLIR